MLSDRKTVARYLAFAKQYASNGFAISPRPKNRDFMLAWGIDFDTARDIVMSLTICNYVSGPLEDNRDLGRNDVWVFGRVLVRENESVEAYIKIVISKEANGLGCLCVSFHNSEYPLNYAYGDEQREVYVLP